MPLLDDLVAERSTTTGTGNLTVSAAAGGFRRLATVFGLTSASQFQYHARHTNAGEWEVGRGFMSDSNTLVRNRVLKSSNSNAAVDFSAGAKEIFVDIPGDASLVVMGLARLVYNTSGAAIPANKLVTITTYNSTEGLSQIELADNAASGRPADGYLPAQIDNNAAGWILAAGEVGGVDTSGHSDGDPIFLDMAGGFTVGAPASGSKIQEVGNIVETAVAGIIHFRLTQQRERLYLTDWITGMKYFKKEVVVDNDKMYRANVDHTAGPTFVGDAASWDEQSPASSGEAVQMTFFIETPEVKDYALIGANGVAWDVDSCTVKTTAGTGTYDLEINGMNIAGIDNQPIGTSPTQDVATSANSLTLGGERLSFRVKTNVGMANLEITILGTKT